MYKSFVSFTFVIICYSAYSQDSTSVQDEIFTIVEQMPEFPGGEIELLKYLASVKYPVIAKENDIMGMVYIRFVIDTAGKVTK